MPNAIFHSSAHSRAARIIRGINHSLAIVLMDLLESRRLAQFLLRITKHFLVGRTVVEPLAVCIDNGNHVRRILADQPEKLLSFGQLLAESGELHLLKHHVNIEEQNHAD